MNTKPSLARFLLAVIVSAACILLLGCPKDSKEEDTVTDTDTTTDTDYDYDYDDEPTDTCEYRPDPLPPQYNWTYQTAPVGQTTARYYAPASPVGLVVLFDGGGGVPIWFNRIEPRRLVEALVDAGYAIVALESDDPTDGNFDPTDAATNVDIVNLQTAIGQMESTGQIPADTPIFYLGFSSGGFFGSLATRYEPAHALVLLNVRGDSATYDPALNPDSPPPTLWVIGENDSRVLPDDAGLLTNQSFIDAAGVSWESYINEPIGASEYAFARIADPSSAVSASDSADAVSQLFDAGYLDPCNIPVNESANLDLTVIALEPSFTAPFTEEAKRQIDELYGAHEITSDFNDEIVAFLDAHQ
ncbi:MAG: hypothetical protein AAF481_17080 [Acidobacteriota bacterium]